MGFRRNLVIVLAHGLRYDVLGDGETWPMQTPNLAKLRQRSLMCTATSACPADDGGMVSLLTGLHARQHGWVQPTLTPPAVAGWPAAMAAAGYHMVGVGRIAAFEHHLHHAVSVMDLHCEDERKCAYLRAAAGRGILDPVRQQRRQRRRYGPFQPDRAVIEPEDDVDGFIAASALRELEQMPADRPWCLIVSLTGPGNDLPPPLMYDEIVDPLTVEDGFLPVNLAGVDNLAQLDYPRTLLQRLDRQQIARIRSDYLGRVALLDYGVGRLAAGLTQRPDAAQTWMLTTADRGQLLGEHGLVGHRSFLGSAVEVPLLISPPTPAPRQLADDQVSTVDIAATVTALAGCDLPTISTGRSLLPLLAGEAIDIAPAGIISEFANRLMLETDRHKLVFDIDRRRPIALFDLLNDPDEMANLLDESLGRNLLDALRWRLSEALMPLRAAP